MSTQPADSPQLSYWQLPATKWDAAKFALPFLFAAVGALVTLWFTVQAQAQDMTGVKASIVQFRDVKEDRGTRLSVVENEVKTMHEEQQKNNAQMRDDLKEMRADIKLLLQRGVK